MYAQTGFDVSVNCGKGGQGGQGVQSPRLCGFFWYPTNLLFRIWLRIFAKISDSNAEFFGQRNRKLFL